MSDFGDVDPEDAWDDGDPLDDRLALIIRIIQAIRRDDDGARAERRRLEVIRLLGKVTDEIARG